MSQRGCLSRNLFLVRAVRHPFFLFGGGQSGDPSSRRGREEGRRKKRLTCQIVQAVPRAAVRPGSSGPFSPLFSLPLPPCPPSMSPLPTLLQYFYLCPGPPFSACSERLCLQIFRSCIFLPCSPWLFFSFSVSI